MKRYQGDGVRVNLNLDEDQRHGKILSINSLILFGFVLNLCEIQCEVGKPKAGRTVRLMVQHPRKKDGDQSERPQRW